MICRKPLDDLHELLATKRRTLRGLVFALLGLAACADRPVAETKDGTSTSDASASGTSTSDAGTSDGPVPPDLGADAVVCGELGDATGTDEDIALLAGCEIYQGGLSLHYPDVTDISPLISLRILRGTITTGGYNSHLESLAGLDNLEWVGSFHFNADALGDLTAMSKLAGTDYFALWGMPDLGDLHGLEQLHTVSGTFSLEANPELTTLDGLSGLEWIGGDLEITSHEKLASLDGLATLQRVDGDVKIYENSLLPPADIDAFLNRIEIGGEVYLD